MQEQLDDHWSAWFGGLTLSRGEDTTTALRGPVADQAALYGLLDKTRDLGLTLISVRRIDRTISPRQASVRDCRLL